jgi:tetratricopeptide (TPR) repeat protein
MTSTRSSILASALVLFVSANAAAQSGTAIAEGLFREGKKLLDAKKFSEACPKFEESARLDPSSGVELALGICYEGLGKTASAWAAYETAVSLARRDNRKDREKAATAKAAALEPKLAHVTFQVPEPIANLPGLPRGKTRPSTPARTRSKSRRPARSRGRRRSRSTGPRRRRRCPSGRSRTCRWMSSSSSPAAAA